MDDISLNSVGRLFQMTEQILQTLWCQCWRFGVAVIDQPSCSTLSPISTGMGDCLRAAVSLRNQPPRPT